jgi:hypothetical protein
VTFDSGSRLERINESAFSSSGLKSIEIPPNVAIVCGSAFIAESLNSISVSRDNRYFRIRESFLEDICGSTIYRYFGSSRSIEIPSSIVVLGKSSFHGCKSLESVTFQSGSRLERINESAFSSSGLKSIEIPRNVAFVCGSSLATDSLCSISVSGDNQHFLTRESFLEDICSSTIYRYFGSCRSIVIPSSVVVLGKSCFHECKSLESVIFESRSRLERIEEKAFQSSGLKSIVIPSSVVIMGESSFQWCASLESVTFESGARFERVEGSAFSGSGLQSIVIPSSVVVLQKECFSGCASLESVTFDSYSRLERIDECVFSGSGLKSIVIPSSVVVLRKGCFCLCSSLESVTFDSCSQLERIEESAFRWSGLKSIEIPSSVVVLGEESFYECKSLESVTFESGSRMEPIEQSAFYGTRVNFSALSYLLAASRSKLST